MKRVIMSPKAMRGAEKAKMTEKGSREASAASGPAAPSAVAPSADTVVSVMRPHSLTGARPEDRCPIPGRVDPRGGRGVCFFLHRGLPRIRLGSRARPLGCGESHPERRER